MPLLTKLLSGEYNFMEKPKPDPDNAEEHFIMKIRIMIICISFIILSLCVFFNGRPLAMGTKPGPLDYNLILITIDTIRADHLGCYGYKSVQTPNIDKLASGGVLFSTAISPVPITLPSHSTIMTGLYPGQHGVRNNGTFFLSKEATTLAELMKGHGYQTGACVGACVLDSVYGLDQGFDYYNDHFTPGKLRENFLFNERKGEEVNRVAIKWIEDHRDGRFFLWLHYFDPHSPYFPPIPYSLKYFDHLYDGEIAYVDACIGELLEKIWLMGLMDNTVIILVGDHGEGLGEHNEDTHAIFIYDSTLRVPFIIWAPLLLNGGRNIQSLVSTIDILPTVIGLFNLKQLTGIAGKDLMPLIQGRDKEIHPQILCESLCPELNFGCSRLEGIRTSEWKYIYAPKPELFHLAEDPDEKNNLFEREGYDHNKWKTFFDKIKKDYQPATWIAQQKKLDPETEQKLRSLGYIWTRSETDLKEDMPRPDPKDMIHVMNDLDSGVNSLIMGQHDQAIEKLQEVLAVDERNLAAYFYLGWAYEAKDQLDKAQMFYRKILEIDSQYNNVYNNLGLIHYKKGEWDLALKEFQNSLDLFETPEVYYNVSLVYTRKGKTEEAMASVKKSIELDPEYAEAWNQLGNLYNTRNDLKEAAKHYEKAVNLNPGYVTALVNLGLVYTKLEEVEKGFEQFQLAVRIDPNNVEAHNNLGSLYLGQGKYDQAMLELQKALDIRPDNKNAMINLGALYMNLKDYQKAEQFLMNALELDKNYAEVYNQLGYLYLLREEFDKAASRYQEALRIQPDNSKSYYYLGKAYQALGQKNDAIKTWENALNLQPDLAGIHLDLGNVYFEINDFHKAQQEWQIAFDGRPVDIPAHLMNMGMFYFKSEQYEMAIRAWQKACELKPDEHDIHYNLAFAYFKKGQYSDAELEARECLRLRPDSQNALQLIDRIKQVQKGISLPK